MKTKIIVSVIVVLTWAVSNSRAQEFTLTTTTSANTASSMAKIEVPALTGNPQAIIVATPVGETKKLKHANAAAVGIGLRKISGGSRRKENFTLNKT